MLNNTKTLIIDLTTFYGGGQKFVSNIYEHTKCKDRYFFSVANTKLFDELKTDNKILLQAGFMENIASINRFIKKKQINTVILNGNRPIYFAPFIRAKSKIAYRHTSNNAFKNMKLILAPIFLNLSFLFCTKVIVLYQKAVGEIWQKSKVKVINNGISLHHIEPVLKNDICNKVVISCISRLNSDKGINWLIDAFSEEFKLQNDVILNIAGEGEMRDYLANKVINSGADIRLMGFVSDINGLLLHSDIFVLPSKFEAFPLSILEAMNYSLPIIATNTGGVPEIIDTGKEGFIINYKDTEALKKAMNILVNNTEERKRMGRNAFNKVTQFNINNNISQIENLLNNLV